MGHCWFAGSNFTANPLFVSLAEFVKLLSWWIVIHFFLSSINPFDTRNNYHCIIQLMKCRYDAFDRIELIGVNWIQSPCNVHWSFKAEIMSQNVFDQSQMRTKYKRANEPNAAVNLLFLDLWLTPGQSNGKNVKQRDENETIDYEKYVIIMK